MWEPREEPGLWQVVVKEAFLKAGGAGTGARRGRRKPGHRQAWHLKTHGWRHKGAERTTSSPWAGSWGGRSKGPVLQPGTRVRG